MRAWARLTSCLAKALGCLGLQRAGSVLRLSLGCGAGPCRGAACVGCGSPSSALQGRAHPPPQTLYPHLPRLGRLTRLLLGFSGLGALTEHLPVIRVEFDLWGQGRIAGGPVCPGKTVLVNLPRAPTAVVLAEGRGQAGGPPLPEGRLPSAPPATGASDWLLVFPPVEPRGAGGHLARCWRPAGSGHVGDSPALDWEPARPGVLHSSPRRLDTLASAPWVSSPSLSPGLPESLPPTSASSGAPWAPGGHGLSRASLNFGLRPQCLAGGMCLMTVCSSVGGWMRGVGDGGAEKLPPTILRVGKGRRPQVGGSV